MHPQDVVEIVCTDPNFLEKATEKKPNFVIRLISGAYSHPRDWWCAIFYCCMQIGLFGPEAKAMSDPWKRDLNTILKFAKENPVLAVRLLSVHLKHQMQTPEFYGRIGGGFFTNYASTGGRFGNKVLGRKGKMLRTTVNFKLANSGAAVLSVKYGGRDIVSVFDAMLTGNYTPSISGEMYKEMFRAAIERNEPVGSEEADALVEIVDGVLHCINNPEEYLPSSSNKPDDSSPHVPVGRVSSMRPDGVRGTIPAGYETNALDVIGDQNARLGEP